MAFRRKDTQNVGVFQIKKFVLHGSCPSSRTFDGLHVDFVQEGLDELFTDDRIPIVTAKTRY